MTQTHDQDSPHEVHKRHRRRRRPLHEHMHRPVLIHRPTPDEKAIHGTESSYSEAFSTLKRALEDNAVMAALRRAVAWGRAQWISDIDFLERLARQVAGGKMIIVSKPPPPKPADGRYAVTQDKPYRVLLAGPFEGSIPHMYLDTVGKVTVGIGKMLPNPAAAQLIKFVHRDTKTAATAPEIYAAFMTVQASVAGRRAATYRSLTNLDLAPGEADRLLDVELRKAEDGGRHLFAGWDTFPYPAQLALLDMIYNMGEGKAVTPAERQRGLREHGLFQFHKLRASIAEGDWAAASRECHRAGIQVSRAPWTRAKFLEAAHIAPPRPDPHRAVPL